MRLRAWQEWGIASRLIAIAVLPALLMFIVVSFALYLSAQDEVRTDVEERGRLLAAALAETSQYGVVSGNVSYLDRTLRGLLTVDKSIAAIEVLDAQRQPIMLVREETKQPPDVQVFERPIQVQVLDVDVFDSAARGPHVSQPTDPRVPLRAGEPAGYVRVFMSPTPLLETKRERYYLAVAVVLLATLFSGLAGLYLAQWLRRPLSAVISALRDIRRGHYDVQLPTTGGGELGELQSTIVEVARNLSITRQDLEDQVAARTRELEKAMEQVIDADAERRRLIAQGNALIEEERRRIAVEIHDHLNAALIFVRLEAQRIAALATKATAEGDAQEIARIAESISQTTADLYAAARRIVKELRPEVIDALGLKGAIQEMVRNYDTVHPHCSFELRSAPGFPNLSGQLAITAYRVVQEALSNVVKHADATRAVVTLGQGANADAVRITIIDDGRGFDSTTRVATGIGLIGMRERVSAAGGTITVNSTPGSGTSITIDLPTRKHTAGGG